MILPLDLKQALENVLSGISRHDLTLASSALTQRYRSSARDQIGSFMNSEAHRLAYLAVRMPATYAVIERALKEVLKRFFNFLPHSLGDFGAGPGTASWVATTLFPSISSVILYERDGEWKSLGQALSKHAAQKALREGKWVSTDLTQPNSLEECDLGIVSYMIGEVTPENMRLFLQQAWQAVRSVLLVIEPGTMHGFERIRVAREYLISLGAHMLAPCPHMRACPMPAGDWCHFSERLERSSLHRAVKEAAMGYEDEKFSYVAFAKQAMLLPNGRILRHPQRHSGHADFSLCHQEGLLKKTVSRKQGEAFKKGRKLEWGDEWNF